MRLRLSLNKVLAVLLLPAALLAAPAPVEVAGRVLDASGSPVAAAAVTAYRSGQSGAAAATTSGVDGRFVLRVVPGDYVVRIEAKNVSDVVETLSVGAGPAASRDFVAAPRLAEEITVHGTAGYRTGAISTATKTDTPLREVPQSVNVVTRELMQDQLMSSVRDVVRYVPGVTLHQGENNRDQLVMRGNSSSADFFIDGVRDDVQYYRDLYNLDRVEILKGPNALIFGRGGAGGVLNRVSKQAGFAPVREVTMNAGAFGNKRAALDFDQPFGDATAVRINAMREDSESFRDGVSLQRWGVAPSVTFVPADNTIVSFAFEHFRDDRIADRGITSFGGRPADVAIDTYYGDPDNSFVRANVDLATASIEHHFGSTTIRNRTVFGAYDRGYQNYVPGAASADRSTVLLTAYNNATARRNLFNQLDITHAFDTGFAHHTLLAGVEAGRQSTNNLRNTGYFNNATTSVAVPFASPLATAPVVFRQSATDANNHVDATVAAMYAQDQVAITPHVKLVGGVRFDRFHLDYSNKRNGNRLGRDDDMISPRAGLIVTPASALSLYGSYSISYLPSAGDQFSSLTSITEQLKPERFTNSEVGAKWDSPAGLALTAAIYRLDRTNTRSTDPNDPTRAIQTGSQRTDGLELSAEGSVMARWSIAGGYAYQDALVTSATASARKGARVAQVPQHMFSLWNRYSISDRVGLGLGVVRRSDMFAAIDNTVTLPGYTEVDAAAYFTVTSGVRLQVNAENLLNTVYYANADSNTNISPGSPRAVRVAVITRF